MSEILTPEQVAIIRIARTVKITHRDVLELCESHEALRSSLTEETQRREQATRERDAAYDELQLRSWAVEDAARMRAALEERIALCESRSSDLSLSLETRAGFVEAAVNLKIVRAALASPAPPAEEK